MALPLTRYWIKLQGICRIMQVLKFEKGVEFEKNSGKQKQKPFCLLVSHIWKPSYCSNANGQNVHGMASAVQWALCREPAHSPTAVSKHKESNYHTSSQSNLIDVAIWKYQLLLYLHILWNHFRNRLNIQLFYKNKNYLGLHKLYKIQHHL